MAAKNALAPRSFLSRRNVCLAPTFLYPARTRLSTNLVNLSSSSDEVAQAHRDYYLHTIDAFGPSRCMFESNFPVDKLSMSYSVYWNAMKKIASEFSDDEQHQLFYGTAARVYRV